MSHYSVDLSNEEKCKLEIYECATVSIIRATSQDLSEVAEIKVDYSKLGQAIDNWRKDNGDLTYSELESIRENIEDELEEKTEQYKDLERDYEELREKYNSIKRLY